MNPSDPPTQQTPPQQAVQYPFWYVPGVTVFGAKRCIATVSPGLVRVTDAASGQELYRHSLGPDLRIKTLLGTSRITYVNGASHGIMDRQYGFYFYDPRLVLISWLFMLPKTSIAKRFAASCRQAAGLQ